MKGLIAALARTGLVIITAIFGIYIANNLLSGIGVNLVAAILLGLVIGVVLSFLTWNLLRWINNIASHNKNKKLMELNQMTSSLEHKMKYLLLTTIAAVILVGGVEFFRDIF